MGWPRTTSAFPEPTWWNGDMVDQPMTVNDALEIMREAADSYIGVLLDDGWGLDETGSVRQALGMLRAAAVSRSNTIMVEFYTVDGFRGNDDEPVSYKAFRTEAEAVEHAKTVANSYVVRHVVANWLPLHELVVRLYNREGFADSNERITRR